MTEVDVDDGITASLDGVCNHVPHVTLVRQTISSVRHIHVRKIQITCNTTVWAAVTSQCF